MDADVSLFAHNEPTSGIGQQVCNRRAEEKAEQSR